MLEVEKIKKPPKRHAPSGSVTPLTRAQSPASVLTSGSKFNTRATNTSCGRGWGARRCLPETEVKLEFIDLEEQDSHGHREIRPSSSQKGSEGDLPQPKKRLCSLHSGSLVPSPDQVFLEEQEEGDLGLNVCRKRRACSRGRPGFHSPASRAEGQAGPGRSQPKGDSKPRDPVPVLGQEPSVRPEKVMSAQKAPGRRAVGQPAGETSKDPVLSPGPAPSPPGLVQAASPGGSEVGQPGENEEVKQADILIARLDREVRRLKKWKKRHLLPGTGARSLLGFQKPPFLKKLIRTIEETNSWASRGRSPGPRDTAGQKPTLDVGRFFATDRKTVCRATCTRCHASIGQGKTNEQSKTSGLICPLVSKHGLEGEGRPTAASPGMEGARAVEEQKGLPTGAASLVHEGLLSTEHHPGGSASEDGDGQPVPRKWEQAAPTKDKPPPFPAAVGDDQGGICALSQARFQAWDRSITELLCSLALPLSFFSSPPFRRFMAQADPCYHLPSPAFFSDKALPLLRKATGEQIHREMRGAEGSCIHLTLSTAAQEVVAEDYVAVTAHWGVIQPSDWQVVSGSPRKRAVLWVRGLSLESTVEDRQRELQEQVRLWLGRGSLRPGFLLSSGCPSLEQAVTAEGYTHIPCFAHCLSSLVRNFLCYHHSVQIILGTARAICGHFQGSAEARQLLRQLQRRCGLPAHQPFWELSDRWVSAFHLMEWLVEQQRPLREYEEKHQLERAGMALSDTFWGLTESLVRLLRPFQMVVQEASSPQASLSQVLPQLRYLHIFLEQIHGHFEEQSGGEMGAAIRLAQGLALQLSTDGQLNKLFHHEVFVLATLLDPRFKGQIEAILPVGADIDHWKQVLVYKVKEIMVSECSWLPSPFLQSPKDMCVDAASGSRRVKGPGAAGKGQKEPAQRRGSSLGSLLLGQREKSLLEQLESVGLLASQRNGASLSTESHLATVIVKKYLRENETVGAEEDPLAYWERKRDVWPALARLATVYLSCPATSAFSGSVFASLDSPTIVESNSPLPMETVEHLLFLKTNLENFPNYAASPRAFPSGDVAEGEQSRESVPAV